MTDQHISKLKDQVIAALAGPGCEEKMELISRHLDQLDERMAKLKAENAWLRERRYRVLQEECCFSEREVVKNRLLVSEFRAGNRHTLRVTCPLCHQQVRSKEGIYNYSCVGCGWVADFSREDLEANIKNHF